MAESKFIINFPGEEDFMVEALDNNDFPNIMEFTKQSRNMIPWRDVECNTPFKVLGINEITTVNGKAMVVTLQKQDNTTIKAWTTDIVRDELLKKQSIKGSKNLYIISLGIKNAQHSNKSYYDFKIIIY